MQFFKLITSLLILSLMSCAASGSAVNIDPMRNKIIYDNPFNEELRKQYIEITDARSKSGDIDNQIYYGNKLMSMVYGNTPDPDNLLTRKIYQPILGELLAARQFLVMSYGKGIDKSLPSTAARAQVMFDCWAEQEESGKPIIGKSCKDEFLKAKDEITEELQVIADEQEVKQEQMFEKQRMAASETAPLQPFVPTTAYSDNEADNSDTNTASEAAADININIPNNKAKLAPQEPLAKNGEKLPGATLIFFDFNKSDISKEAEDDLRTVVEKIKTYNPKKVIIAGHADKVGSNTYNLKLSQKRSYAVRDKLIRMGVDAKLLDVRMYGEGAPLASDIGKDKDRRNRFVSITLMDSKLILY